MGELKEIMMDVTERSIRLQGMGHLSNKFQVQHFVMHFLKGCPQKMRSGWLTGKKIWEATAEAQDTGPRELNNCGPNPLMWDKIQPYRLQSHTLKN